MVNLDNFLASNSFSSKTTETFGSDLSDLLRQRMKRRLESFFKPIALMVGSETTSYWIAGSSCNPEAPNDYDIYPSKETSFDFQTIADMAVKLKCKGVRETRNALTVIINDTPVQFCNYSKTSLKELVDSFDFAHVQIGMEAEIEWEEDVSYTDTRLTNVYTSDEYIKSCILSDTWYTGSEYPLSSMLRLVKYAQRGFFRGKSYIVSQLRILADVVSRGFSSYEDFKDQMEAIDLRLLEENESDAAWRLFQAFSARGLVPEERDTEE